MVGKNDRRQTATNHNKAQTVCRFSGYAVFVTASANVTWHHIIQRNLLSANIYLIYHEPLWRRLSMLIQVHGVMIASTQDYGMHIVYKKIHQIDDDGFTPRFMMVPRWLYVHYMNTWHGVSKILQIKARQNGNMTFWWVHNMIYWWKWSPWPIGGFIVSGIDMQSLFSMTDIWLNIFEAWTDSSGLYAYLTRSGQLLLWLKVIIAKCFSFN